VMAEDVRHLLAATLFVGMICIVMKLSIDA
jgi:hypothetical protein